MTTAQTASDVDTRVADLVRRTVADQVPAAGPSPWAGGPHAAEIDLFDLALVLDRA